MTKESEEARVTRQGASDASIVTGGAGSAMKDAMADVIRSVVSCEGLHPVATMKYVGTLELLICDDPQCAHITARCTHQIPIPEEEDSVPRKYTTSACKWNEEGTMLTCTFCGKDGT